MVDPKLVIVHEENGFLTTKKISDAKPGDEVICRVESMEAAEVFIHGSSQKCEYEMKKDIDGVKVWSKIDLQ